jgi:hypothetical protein
MPRRRAIVLTLALLMLLAIVGALRRLSAPPVQTTAESSRPSVAGVTAEPQAPQPEATRAPSPSPREPKVNLALVTAQENRLRARYPHSSQPLRADEVDPILRDRQPSQSEFPGPDGQQPTLVVFPDQVSFEHPDPIVLYAFLRSGEARVPAQSMKGEILDALGRSLARLEYNDAGLGADREAGDLVYTARLPGADSGGLAGGAYLVRVRAQSADGEQRTGSTGFLYSRPDAQLTGRYADTVSAGNLEVRAEVEVQAAGRFHLEGTLYTQGGAPLAWAQNALNLPPGMHWIALSFFGLILRERGEDGPYVLRYAALSTATSMPNAKNRLAENAYVTAPYHAAEFSDRTYDDPHLIDDAQRLEGAAPAAPAPPADDGRAGTR